MLVIKQLMVPIEFHSISFNTMEVKGDQQLFSSSKFYFLQNIFYVQHKETHTGLEQHEDVNDNLHFWVNYSFS